MPLAQGTVTADFGFGFCKLRKAQHPGRKAQPCRIKMQKQILQPQG
ncbi:hypothetical protein L195_g058546 [Trifolium pratense]|uniref:Uncharacterized protein n=1 Tax=Trifolium pratense TaxID=57577 RepID=A0A2K3JSY3_TRIPR|nr:hypothetical protein L195_g058546 [Trifolium pratense]